MNHFVLPEQPLLIGFHLFYELIFDAIRNFFVTEFGFELFDLLACFFQLFAIAGTGIPVRRDTLVSVMYSTELNSTTSLVTLQRTDRHGILDEKLPHFQLLS